MTYMTEEGKRGNTPWQKNQPPVAHRLVEYMENLDTSKINIHLLGVEFARY